MMTSILRAQIDGGSTGKTSTVLQNN